MTLTRRSLLGATVALAVAGCRARRSRPAARATGVPLADRAALESAAEFERTLIARYDAAVAQLDAVAAGPLSRARARHLAHLEALDAATGRQSPTTPATPTVAPSSTATPLVAPSGSTASALTAALTASAGTLESAAVHADSGQIAGLLASVAAEHAADAAAASETPS